MAARSRYRLLGAGAGLFLMGASIGAVLAWRTATATDVAIGPGTTLAAIGGDQVLSLSFTSVRGMTTVQRSVPGTPFLVQSTFADGRPPQRCSIAPDMAGHLPAFTDLTARRRLSVAERERQYPVHLGVLEVRDTILVEPSGPVLVFTNRERSAVAVILDGHAAEVTLPAAELGWLEQGCEAMSATQHRHAAIDNAP